MTDDLWVYPLGTRVRDGLSVLIDDSIDDWQHTSLMVLDLPPGERRAFDLGDREAIVVPLVGPVTVQTEDAAGSHLAALAGRPSVFAGPTDVAYLPRGSRLTLIGPDEGTSRVAITLAMVASDGSAPPFRHLPVAEVPVELRGTGQCSREVRNFGVPGVLDADSLIACEVITPAGNWSSYPPHKHDVERAGEETALEEIYYFEVQVAAELAAEAPNNADAVGYQRVYASDDRPIDVLAEVRSGDVLLVPYGWHGPAMAAPGYDLYYLNVMAGAGPERAWLICDDPAHSWIRQTWPATAADPRLPLSPPGQPPEGQSTPEQPSAPEQR